MTVKTIIPDDWQPEDGYTIGMFCLPNSVAWKSVVAGQINNLTYGRTWDINTGNVKDAQTLAESIMESLTMSCDDVFTGIVDALGAITLAMNAQASAIANVQVAISNQIQCGCETVGTTVPEEPAEGEPDVGEGTPFEDQAAYDAYKCQTAGTIIYSLRSTQVLLIESNAEGYFGAAIAIATAAVVYVLGAAGLVEALTQLGKVAEIVGSLVQGETLSLQNVLDAINANDDDLLCRLYCATSTADAMAEYSEWVDTLGLTTAEEIYLNIFNFEAVMNRLFGYAPEKLNLVITPDCSGCECNFDPCEWMIAPQAAGVTIPGGGPVGSGTITQDGNNFVLNSVQDAAGTHRLIIMKRFYQTSPNYPAAPPTDGSACDCDADDGYSITNVSGLPSNPTLSSRGCASNQFGSVSWPGTGQTSTTAMWLSIARSTGSGGAFSITMRVNP